MPNPRFRITSGWNSLGDAVLELLISEYLLKQFPGWTEGQLSKSRARIVNAHSLEISARKLGLGEHLRLGRGEEKTGGREKPTLLADAFEAVVAAIYLDGGLEPVRGLLSRTVLLQALENGENISESDRKSALQEFLQGRGEQPAEYKLAGESGPRSSENVSGGSVGQRRAHGQRGGKHEEGSGTKSGPEHPGEIGDGES